MSMLEKAIIMATEAHRGQKDHMGEPYILHPLRVMLSAETEEEQIVAVLHDVIEDTKLTMGDLRRAGFSEEVLAAVEVLTHWPSATYEEYILKIKTNAMAVKLKLADLTDNMNIRRIRELKDKDLERMRRYHKAWFTLTDIGS